MKTAPHHNQIQVRAGKEPKDREQAVAGAAESRLGKLAIEAK